MLVNLVNSWLYLLLVTTRVISLGDLYCCLLPQCEALRTCRSGFPIATAEYTDAQKVAPRPFGKYSVFNYIAMHSSAVLTCLSDLLCRWQETEIKVVYGDYVSRSVATLLLRKSTRFHDKNTRLQKETFAQWKCPENALQCQAQTLCNLL